MRPRISGLLRAMSRSHGLSPAEVAEIQNSFDRMWPRSNVMVDLFYDRLFELVPDSRPLFRDDMANLKRKFISTLAVIVGSLDNLSGLLSVADKLARDHVHYGVTASHYAPVGEALLWSMREGLGTHWTPAVEDAWTKLYVFLSGRMIAAAYA
ncbi:Globin [Rhodopseudomonas palustris HaA2]|uniref:Globin n=2 Tax=Rhodopseudomonas palustris TaxID=1076 RepID=Q2IZ95_RHOP2|nr:Globin [Rhodopseudomonas palustris HaA2]